MVKVDEVHGIFQCLDISSDTESVEIKEENAYVALISKPGWFWEDDLIEVEAKGLRNPKLADKLDYSCMKPRLDDLFYRKMYREGFELARTLIKFHGQKVKRELMDVYSRFAIKCDDKKAIRECIAWYECNIKVSDTGIVWTRIGLAVAIGDKEKIRKTCDAYLEFRPGELEIHNILSIIE